MEWDLLQFNRATYAKPTRTRDSKVVHKDNTVSFFLDETLHTLVSWGQCVVVHNRRMLNGPHCRVYSNGRLAIEGTFEKDKLVEERCSTRVDASSREDCSLRFPIGLC